MNTANDNQFSSTAAQLMAIEVISELLVSTSPLKLGEVLTGHLRELTGARTVMVLIHRQEPEPDELLYASPLRRAGLFSPSELNCFCTELSPGELPFSPDELPPDHPLKTFLLKAGIQSMARYPLNAGGERVGLLLLFDLPGMERIGETTQIITLLAPPIALALKNALAFRLIEEQALKLEQRIEERTAELRKSEELHRSVLATTMEGYWLVDADMHIQEVNDAYCQMSGFSKQELCGIHIKELEAIDSEEAIVERRSKITACGKARFESQHRRKDGSLFFVAVSIAYLPFDGGRFAVFINDISEQKQAEEQLTRAKVAAESANSAKSRFLANMSHEIRTPMNGIIAISQLLQMTELTEEQREYTGLLTSSSRNLLKLISDILDLSRIEAGSVVLDMYNFDLRAELTDTVSIFTLLAQEKGLEFDFLIAPDVPLLLIGDMERLRQIVTNLIGNAIKFSTNGTISLHISKETDDEQHVSLRFQVRDSGIGISQNSVGNIFEAFTQADNTTGNKYGGTGLGLTIARHLVELQGGSIGVESLEGRGSAFWFTVLLQKQLNTLYTFTAERAVEPSVTNNSNIRILLVEDDEANQYAFKRLLTKSSFQLEIAENGSEALKLLKDKDFDVVLMDCRMPVMDGYEATAAIRDQSSQVRDHDIPVIALTANAMREDRKKCLDAGMDDYLSKPVDFPMLLALIEKWVKTK
jgi:PAS domain S-box-containing protein